MTCKEWEPGRYKLERQIAMSDYHRIIVTGGRNRDSNVVLVNLLGLLQGIKEPMNSFILVQGGCSTGADKAARDVAEVTGCLVETHKANWKLYGRAAGPIRNKEMASLGAQYCIAFPGSGKSAGTWNMVEEAFKAGIMTLVIPVAPEEKNNGR